MRNLFGMDAVYALLAAAGLVAAMVLTVMGVNKINARNR